MPKLRSAKFVASCLFVILCAFFPLLVCAENAEPAAASRPAPAPASRNPYDRQLDAVAARIPVATAPEVAVLLDRAYRLRDYVDDPTTVEHLLQRITDDPQQHRLVRDEASRYLAAIDLHTNRLPAAASRLTALGFIRDWVAIGPFAGSQALDTQYGPEQGFRSGQTFADSSGNNHAWRVLPPLGPQMWADLASVYPHAGSGVAFVASSIYSDAPQTVALRFASDSAVVLMVNGNQIFVDRNDRSAGFDQHAVAVQLQAGWNSVLLKLARNGEGPWRFAVRVTALDGGGLALKTSAQQESNPPVAVGAQPNTAVAKPADLVDMASASVSADPNSATAVETLAALERLHARGEDVDHFEAAARRSGTAQRWLAVAENCGENSCVFAALHAALRAEPENEPARIALANYYFARGQLEKARDLLQEALQREPGDFVARNGLADLYVSLGLNAEALKQSEQLEHEFPNPLWLKRKLAARFLDLGLFDRAQSMLTAALSRNFDGTRERALLLRLYEKRRDADGLRSTYEDVLRLNPADPTPLAELATLDTGAGDYPSAQRHMQAALAIAPEDDDLHQRFANLLARAGHQQGAHAEFARAVQINPNQDTSRRWLGTNSKTDSAGAEAAYLADPAQEAADARRTPPAADSNAVVLADVRVERVFDNGLSAVRRQLIYYIATQQGVRDFSARSVQYTPGTQALHVLHARVYKHDGRVLEGEESGEGGVADASVAMYYDVRSRTVRFPAVEKGDVVELDYCISPTTNANPYGDYFGGLVVFRSNLPEDLQRYVLITPARRRFNILEQHMMRASVTEQGDERVYRWEIRDMMPLSNEPKGPALTDVAPYVHVSTFQSWDDLGRWYAQLIQPQFALDGTLRDEAARLLKNARTEQERISAIHQFVLRNTHYVAMEFGIYSYKPYPVSQVYARRFGDCKDKASLMIALLRQAGIDAEIALVRTRRLGVVNPQATSIALFNHAIVYIPKYDLWLDGTAEYAGSRELPLDDQGATALTVGLSGHATLRHIPVTQPTDNYTRRTVRAKVMTDGRIEFSGVTYTRGEDAPGLRREYETPERQRDAVRNTLAQVFPSVRLDDVHVDGANDLEHPITVEFRGALDTFDGRTSVPLAASWMPRSYVQELAALATRAQDLVLPAPWTTEEDLHFELPSGASVKSVPTDTVLDTAFGTASLHYQRNGRELVIRTSVQFRKLRVTPDEYESFRDFCQQVERAFHNEIKIALRG